MPTTVRHRPDWRDGHGPRAEGLDWKPGGRFPGHLPPEMEQALPASRRECGAPPPPATWLPDHTRLSGRGAHSAAAGSVCTWPQHFRTCLSLSC